MRNIFSIENLDTEKINKYLRKKAAFVFDGGLEDKVYLTGSAVKILGYDLDYEINDLDFIVQSISDDSIKILIDKYYLKYTRNHFGGYKILLPSGLKIDIWNTLNFESTFEYNFDKLLYDVKEKKIVSLGFEKLTDEGLKRLDNAKHYKPGERDGREEERYQKIVKMIRAIEEKTNK